MGVDPALGSDFPAVFINGEKFHYGKEPEFGQWMVSHPYEGKRYWCFDAEQDMIDFLENLPESSEPPQIGGAPIWYCHGSMPQAEYDQIFGEYKAYLHMLLEKRRLYGLTYQYE